MNSNQKRRQRFVEKFVKEGYCCSDCGYEGLIVINKAEIFANPTLEPIYEPCMSCQHIRQRLKEEAEGKYK